MEIPNQAMYYEENLSEQNQTNVFWNSTSMTHQGEILFLIYFQNNSHVKWIFPGMDLPQTKATYANMILMIE